MLDIEDRCRNLLHEEKYEEAARLLDEVLEETPSVLALKGRALSGMQHWQEAQEAFEAALEEDRDCHEALAGLGLLSMLFGDLHRALELLHEAAQVAPREGRYRSLRGLVEAQLGDAVSALEDFESARNLGHKDSAAALVKAQILLAQGKVEPGRIAIEEAQVWGATESSLLPLRAAVHRIEGEPEKALEIYREAVRVDPTQAPLWWELVGLTAALDRDRLDEVLQQALQAHPDDERILVVSVGRLREAGLADQALATLRSALDRQPDSVSLWAVLGDYLRELDRFEESLDCFERALAIDPYFARAHFGKGLAIGQREAAVESFAAAAQLAPENVVYVYHFGSILCSLENYESAIKVLDKAIRLDGTFWRAYQERAICYQNTDRFQHAQADREKAEELKKAQSVS